MADNSVTVTGTAAAESGRPSVSWLGRVASAAALGSSAPAWQLQRRAANCSRTLGRDNRRIPAIGRVAELAQRRASFAIPASTASVGTARAQAVGLLTDWNAPVDADVAELLLSEVVTNAVLHGFGECPDKSLCIEVELTLTPAGLRVAVYDPDLGDSDAVSVRHPDTECENGHGLELVEALSTSWGCEPTADGKRVFFELEPSEQRIRCGHWAQLEHAAEFNRLVDDFIANN